VRGTEHQALFLDADVILLFHGRER
jgi:hypothetical protein